MRSASVAFPSEERRVRPRLVLRFRDNDIDFPDHLAGLFEASYTDPLDRWLEACMDSELINSPDFCIHAAPDCIVGLLSYVRAKPGWGHLLLELGIMRGVVARLAQDRSAQPYGEVLVGYFDKSIRLKEIIRQHLDIRLLGFAIRVGAPDTAEELAEIIWDQMDMTFGAEKPLSMQVFDGPEAASLRASLLVDTVVSALRVYDARLLKQTKGPHTSTSPDWAARGVFDDVRYYVGLYVDRLQLAVPLGWDGRDLYAEWLWSAARRQNPRVFLFLTGLNAGIRLGFFEVLAERIRSNGLDLSMLCAIYTRLQESPSEASWQAALARRDTRTLAELTQLALQYSPGQSVAVLRSILNRVIDKPAVLRLLSASTRQMIVQEMTEPLPDVAKAIIRVSPETDLRQMLIHFQKSAHERKPTHSRVSLVKLIVWLINALPSPDPEEPFPSDSWDTDTVTDAQFMEGHNPDPARFILPSSLFSSLLQTLPISSQTGDVYNRAKAVLEPMLKESDKGKSILDEGVEKGESEEAKADDKLTELCGDHANLAWHAYVLCAYGADSEKLRRTGYPGLIVGVQLFREELLNREFFKGSALEHWSRDVRALTRQFMGVRIEKDRPGSYLDRRPWVEEE